MIPVQIEPNLNNNDGTIINWIGNDDIIAEEINLTLNWLQIRWSACMGELPVEFAKACYHRPVESITTIFYSTLQWRHNGRDCIPNHQPNDYLLNRLFRRRSKKHQSSASLAFVWGIHRWPMNSRTNGQWRGNVSIWWRHHDYIIGHRDIPPARTCDLRSPVFKPRICTIIHVKGIRLFPFTEKLSGNEIVAARIWTLPL